MRSVLPIRVTFVVVLSACGGPLDAPPPAPEPEPPPGPSIRRLSGPEAPLRLPAWGAADLRVTLSEVGQPVPDAPIDFALPPEAGPARLSALRVVTDAAGEAVTRVIAGGSPGRFAVTAAAEDAEPLGLVVEIGAASVQPAVLEVAVRPVAGAPPPETLRLTLSTADGDACERGTESGNGPLATVQLPGSAGGHRFEGLDPSVPATLEALALRGGTEVARACLEGLALSPGGLLAVTAELQPLPARPAGDWRLSHTMEIPGGLAAAVQDVAATLAPAFDDADDPARWLVARAADEAGLRLGVYAEPAIRRVAAVLDQTLPPAALGLPGHLQRVAAGWVTIGVETTAVFEPGPCDGQSLQERWVAVDLPAPTSCTGPCGGRRLSLYGRAPIETVRSVAGDPFELELPSQASPYPLGRLVDLFVREVVWDDLAPGATDTRSLLLGLVGCGTVGRAIAASDGLDDGLLGIGTFVATEKTLAFACEDALEDLARRTDSVLARLADTLYPPLSLAGTARWVHEDADTTPDRLVGGSWCGGFEAPWGDLPACGTFEGAPAE